MQKPIASGVWRGLKGRCPHCGQGKLFRQYLKVQETCTVCGHDNGRYPADDAPAYFTVLLLGHLVVAPILVFNFILDWPAGKVLAVTLPLLFLATLIILPRVKGAVVGLQWALKDTDGRDLEARAAQMR